MSSHPSCGLHLRAAPQKDAGRRGCAQGGSGKRPAVSTLPLRVMLAVPQRGSDLPPCAQCDIQWCDVISPTGFKKCGHSFALCISGTLLVQHIYSMIYSQVCFLLIFLYFALCSQRCSDFRRSVGYWQRTGNSTELSLALPFVSKGTKSCWSRCLCVYVALLPLFYLLREGEGFSPDIAAWLLSEYI